MVIIKLSSGIGNQLFQYAFALYLEQKYNLKVLFDTNSFQFDKYRRNEIDILHPSYSIYNAKRFFTKFRGIKYRLLLLLFRINVKNKYITETTFSDNLKLDENKTYYFDGYWQTDRFVSQIIKPNNLFTPKETIPIYIKDCLSEINESKSVSIHIRRGDYFSPQYIKKYGVCTEKYYNESINYFTRRGNDYKFFVFSDDMSWVKQNLKLPDNTTYIKNEKINDFWYIYIMSKCKHNIISNSTFSWWGAYLNTDPDKIIIAPAKWMLNTDKTIALNNWIKIEII